jgi:hypothetical protein
MSKKEAQKTEVATLTVPQHVQDNVDSAQSWTQMYGDVTELRVYNPEIWKEADPDKVGKIFIGKPSEWIEFWDSIEGTILHVKKSWAWWVPNEYWGKDTYYTNELWVWDKAVKLKWIKQTGESPSDREEVFIWTGSIENFYKLIQDEAGPFFRKTAEAMDGSMYPVSWLDRVNMLYIRTEKGETFRLNPKSSFWKWNNVKPWTIEQLKVDATNEYNMATKKNVKTVDLSVVKFKATVWTTEVMWKIFYVLKWEFKGFTENDLLKEAQEVKKLIESNNTENFPKTLDTLPSKAADMKMIPAKVALADPELEATPF